MIFFLSMATNQEMNFILLLMNQKNNKFEPFWRRKGTEETKSNNRFLFIFCLYLFDLLFDIYIYIYIILIDI